MIIPDWTYSALTCPPLGLAYIAAAMRTAGYSVRCVDAIGEKPFQRVILGNSDFLSVGLSTPEIVEQVGQCDILGVSLMFSQDWPLMKSILQAIRKENPNTVIICGGEHITAVPEFCLNDCPEIDICVLGEGEETAVELIKTLQSGNDLSKVSGIVYRSDQAPVRTAPRPRIKELEEIAWPAWDLFPVENYFKNKLGHGVNAGRTIPLLASRGCPYQCTFCSSPKMWTTKWQARATEDVISEMQCYIEHYQIQNFDLFDLTAILRKDWIVDFCKKIIEKKWDITWQLPSGTRSEALDEEVLRYMVLSGQKNISYAPESGSHKTLKQIKKKVNLGIMKKSMRTAVKEGMNIKLNMVMGFPQETWREILETYRFLIEVAILGIHDVITISCFSPYPGSELFDELQQSGKIKKLDQNYFFRLTKYSDILRSYSYSPYISNLQLTFYRLFGMFLFYSVSYTLRPIRLFKLIYNFLKRKEETRMDIALQRFIQRLLSDRIYFKNANLF